jgi:hypothetical protein
LQGKGLTAPLIALVRLLLIAGCGGGEEDSTSAPVSSQGTSTSTAAEVPEEIQEQAAEDKEKALAERREAEEDKEKPTDKSAQPPRIEHSDSGGGSAQFRQEGGDNSIPDYGQEASATEREAAADTLHAFFDSMVAHRWEAACAEMSASMLANLERLSEVSKQQEAPEGCAQLLANFSESTPQSTLEEAAIVDVISLRFEDDSGFLIYRGAGGDAYVMPVIKEEGAWRVGALAGTPIL